MTTQELAQLTGVHWSTLHRWIHKGLIGGEQAARGSGNRRVLSPEDVEHALVTTRLYKAGLRPEVAARAAAELAFYGFATLGGFTIEAAS